MSLLWKTEVLQSFFQIIPVHPYKLHSSFIFFSNKRKKKILLALLHYRPKCENAKVQSASGMVCCIMEDGQEFTVQIPFPFCSMLASFFKRREDSLFPVWKVWIHTKQNGKNQDEGLMCFDAFCPPKVSNWRNFCTF